MAKILFVIPAFKHGGTNKSLSNILPFITEDNDISIMALSHLGPYNDIFSSKVKILEDEYLLSMLFNNYGEISLSSESKKSVSMKVLKKIFQKSIKILIGDKGIELINKKIAKKIDELGFDLVVSFQEGDATRFSSLIHTKKIAWVRSDYEEYYRIVGKDELSIYEKFESIICVSEYTKKKFLKLYPSLSEKSYGIHNIIDANSIIEQAAEDIKNENRFEKVEFNILSIGRLTTVKQFHLIPSVASSLKKRNIVFKWYIIGDGEERKAIEFLIKKYQVENEVIILGEKNNPYPYIKESDLIVVTSFSEACPNVINEAKILHKPVLTTNFGSANEFISDGLTGWIVRKEDIVKGIERVWKDREEFNAVKKNISTFRYSNEEIVASVMAIMKV